MKIVTFFAAIKKGMFIADGCRSLEVCFTAFRQGNKKILTDKENFDF